MTGNHNFRASVFLAIALLFSLSSCSHQLSYEYEWQNKDENGVVRRIGTASVSSTDRDAFEKKVLETTFPGAIPKVAALVVPVDGLFIGVSDFDPRTKRPPMPAHTIGAAFVYSLFYEAAKRTRDNYSVPWAKKEMKLNFLGDLRLDPVDPFWDGHNVAAILHALPGVRIRDYNGASMPPDTLWQYVDAAKPLTKARILDAARKQAARLARPDNKAIGILYLSTHGVLGPDGKSYMMGADSLDGKLSTWISYQEIADLYSRPLDPTHPISIFIIFDSCLDKTSEAPSPTPPPENNQTESADSADTGSADDEDEDSDIWDTTDVKTPDSVEIISAAAPGQYSWHWKEPVTQARIIEGSQGSGLSRRQLQLPESSYYYSLSILPITAGKMLKKAEFEIHRACQNNDRTTGAALTSVELVKVIVDDITRHSLLAHFDSHNASDLQTARTLMSRPTYHAVSSAFTNTPENFAMFQISCDDSSQDDR